MQKSYAFPHIIYKIIQTDKRPNTENRSYAQLTPDEKDAISHRGNALAALEKQLPSFLSAVTEEGVIAQVSGKVEIKLK